MREYHKIDSVFLRDEATGHKSFLLGQWTRPEFGYLADLDWVWTEKVDGTNIRIGITEGGYEIGGRTANAQIPTFLLPVLDEIGDKAQTGGLLNGLMLVGEGYGAKIQNGGNYRTTPGFILFDVFVSETGMPLERDNAEDIAAGLGIDIVPIVGEGNLYRAIDATREGFDSLVAVQSHTAEGLVVRPKVELQDRCGYRVITKVKHRDFTQGF